MEKAIIYTRVSSKRQEEEGTGLDSQEAICRDVARRKGMEVIEVYSDTQSGGNAKRKGLTAMGRFIARNRSTQYVIIFDDVSRFARNLKDHLELRENLRKYSCRIISPSKEFTDDADSLFSENIQACFAEHQLIENREQVFSRRKVSTNASRGTTSI